MTKSQSHCIYPLPCAKVNSNGMIYRNVIYYNVVCMLHRAISLLKHSNDMQRHDLKKKLNWNTGQQESTLEDHYIVLRENVHNFNSNSTLIIIQTLHFIYTLRESLYTPIKMMEKSLKLLVSLHVYAQLHSLPDSLSYWLLFKSAYPPIFGQCGQTL